MRLFSIGYCGVSHGEVSAPGRKFIRMPLFGEERGISRLWRIRSSGRTSLGERVLWCGHGYVTPRCISVPVACTTDAGCPVFDKIGLAGSVDLNRWNAGKVGHFSFTLAQRCS